MTEKLTLYIPAYLAIILIYIIIDISARIIPDGRKIDWDPGITGRNLPASYYHTSKPEFFGSLRWPAKGPDVPGYSGIIPAKARYEDGKVNTGNDRITNPEGFVLMQNYPNPFAVRSRPGSDGNPSTNINYSLPGLGATNRIASVPEDDSDEIVIMMQTINNDIIKFPFTT